MIGIRRTALSAVTIVVGVSLLAGGCRTDREVTEPAPLPVTEKRLTAALITEDDLPDTYTAAPEGTPVNAEIIPEDECDDAIKDLEPETKVMLDTFEPSEGTPKVEDDFTGIRIAMPPKVSAGDLDELPLCGVWSFDGATIRALATTLPTVERVFLVAPQDISLIDTEAKVKAIPASR